MTTRYIFQSCVVEVNDEEQRLVTRFPDDTSVYACANHDDASVAMAHELGYDGDTWAMSRDHELAHHWLAMPDVSDVMWSMAHHTPGDEKWWEEELRVLEYQKSLNKSSVREWEMLNRTDEKG